MSARNLLTGQGHTVSGDDNLIAGVDGTLTGSRSVLLNLDGTARSRTVTGTFEVWGTLVVNGSTVTGGDLSSQLDALGT